jgi:predicted amidohydrolase
LIVVILMGTVGCQARKPVPLTVATVTMNAQTDKAANLEQIASYMAEAAEQGAHLVVFPEVALQQNPGWGNSRPAPEELAYVEDTAESIPGESTDWLTERARELEVYAIFGMTERGEDGKLYNTSVFLGPQGVLAHYRKYALQQQGLHFKDNEDLFYEPGSEPGMVVDSPLGKIGLVIDHEITYGLGASLGAAGADLIVAVAAWPGEEIFADRYDRAVSRAAGECECWLVVANQVDIVGDFHAYGHSKIADSSRNVVADTGAEEGMVIAPTDLLVDPAALRNPK